MEPPSDLLVSFSRIPFNRHIGFRLLSRSSETAVIEMPAAPEFLQETGVVHGAMLTALADTAAVYTFHPDLKDGETMASIEFKVNFLAPAALQDGPMIAHAHVVRRGRKVGVCDVEVKQAGKLVAKGLFTYLFFSRETK